MRRASGRDTLIIFQRATKTENEVGEEVEGWAEYSKEFSCVRFGAARERREAAQTSASQAAIFQVLANSKTRALTPNDRISALGGVWDIVGVAPFGRTEIDVTAVRKSDG